MADPQRVSLSWEARLPGTWSLIGVLATLHGLTALSAWSRGRADLLPALLFARDGEVRAMVGGQVAALVREGEPWRLLTSVLLHADALHLAVNAVAIAALGRVVEPWLGARRLWIVFLLGGLAGSIASHAATVGRSDGASGGAFALLGLVIVLRWRLGERLSGDERWLLGPMLLLLLGVNIALSLALPFIDAAGHLGGLGLGCAMGLGIGVRGAPPWRGARVARVAEGIVLALCGAVCGWGFRGLFG